MTSVADVEKEKERFGPWMLAQRNKRTINEKSKVSLTGNKGLLGKGNNRFAVLGSDGNDLPHAGTDISQGKGGTVYRT